MVQLQDLVATRLGTNDCAYDNNILQDNMVKVLLGCCLNSYSYQPSWH